MFAIILNPVSGGGRNVAVTQQLLDILKAYGHEATVFATECKGDVRVKAMRALEEGYTSIIAVGGDGTLSEIVEAIAGKGVTLYVVPFGTGNDFARSLNLPKDPIKAFEAQLEGEAKAVDCMTANGRAFINVGGSGFDVEVLRKTEELKEVYPGEVAYRKAVLAVLSSYKAFEADVTIDNGETTHERCTIIEVANGKYFGGGMLVAPGSQMDDGLMDVVTVGRVPSWAIPFLLPLFIMGWHVHLPICKVVRAKQVRIQAKGMVVNMDGRLEPMDDVVFGIMPGGVTLMMPKQ